MLPILQIGPLALPVPSLVLLAGVWLGLNWAEHEARRVGLHPDHIYNTAFTAIVAGLLSARLVYAGRYFEAYLADPLGLLAPQPATLDQPAGVALGLVAAVIYAQRHRLPLRATLDALTPAGLTLTIALALAHLASGEAFGAPTTLPWRIFLWEDYRHPSQIYELLGAVSVTGLWFARRLRWQAAGQSFLLAVALTAGVTIFLEAFRGDSWLWPGGWRAAQVVGVGVLAGCWALWERWRPPE